MACATEWWVTPAIERIRDAYFDLSPDIMEQFNSLQRNWQGNRWIWWASIWHGYGRDVPFVKINNKAKWSLQPLGTDQVSQGSAFAGEDSVDFTALSGSTEFWCNQVCLIDLQHINNNNTRQLAHHPFRLNWCRHLLLTGVVCLLQGGSNYIARLVYR